jgi:hypothetical protein
MFTMAFATSYLVLPEPTSTSRSSTGGHESVSFTRRKALFLHRIVELDETVVVAVVVVNIVVAAVVV